MVDDLSVSLSENELTNVQREEASMTLWCWVSHGDVHKNPQVDDNTDRHRNH